MAAAAVVLLDHCYCEATRHDQGLSHTSGQTVCLCAVQGAAERASQDAISHTHTSGQTVCLCTVQGAVARASPDAGAWCGGRRQGSAASRPG